MSIKIGDILAKLPHVVSVAPEITSISTAGAVEVIAGIDLGSYESMSGPFRFLEGGPFRGPNDALVDDVLATSRHVKVGDKIEILNHNSMSAASSSRAKAQGSSSPIATLQDLIGAKNKASLFYLKLDDPANADAVVSEIKQVPVMEKYVATSMATIFR